MDWTRAVDGYCERIGPAYWAEPINAVTNLAFVLAALYMWRRCGNDLLARLLCVVLFAIGVGSYLFHTHAQVWAGMADVLPIVLFILIYIFAINRVGWRLSFWAAFAVTCLFIPYAAVTVPIFQLVPGLGSSAGYAPVPVLILFYAILLRHRDPDLARGLALGAGLLVVSLIFRTLDLPLCARLPLGTHFAWHVLNGLMLGWMIEVYRRARLGKARA
ncbi:ceramidase domain-containing protein [uncultured Roseobacter sp.]|uniref:ceramidase domain-containing protein n=1 Tax=uncultured Roseobacter sp. TaxID=114847 RepID=UPI00261A75DB|nr:ceramidase domain-containing protein [uncultured Roseobacter sp.]